MSPSSKKKGVLNRKCLGLYVTMDNRKTSLPIIHDVTKQYMETDDKTLYYSLLKSKYSPSI